VERVYHDACSRERAYDCKSLSVAVDVSVWVQMPVINGMRTWVREMTSEKFAQGTLIDKLVWTYCLYMTAGFSKIGMKAWINCAVKETGDWLCATM